MFDRFFMLFRSPLLMLISEDASIRSTFQDKISSIHSILSDSRAARLSGVLPPFSAPDSDSSVFSFDRACSIRMWRETKSFSFSFTSTHTHRTRAEKTVFHIQKHPPDQQSTSLYRPITPTLPHLFAVPKYQPSHFLVLSKNSTR